MLQTQLMCSLRISYQLWATFELCFFICPFFFRRCFRCLRFRAKSIEKKKRGKNCRCCHCTVVELNTRPNPLIISKFLQFRTFWLQTKALFIIRCTLSVESWFKTFRVQKWPYWVQNFEFLLHKITNFWGISGCQWTMSSGLFAKKSHTKLFCSC